VVACAQHRRCALAAPHHRRVAVAVAAAVVVGLTMARWSLCLLHRRAAQRHQHSFVQLRHHRHNTRGSGERVDPQVCLWVSVGSITRVQRLQ
jgi:hypothetical protein